MRRAHGEAAPAAGAVLVGVLRAGDRRARLDGLPGRLPLQVDLGQEDGAVPFRGAFRPARAAQLGYAGARPVR